MRIEEILKELQPYEYDNLDKKRKKVKESIEKYEINNES